MRSAVKSSSARMNHTKDVPTARHRLLVFNSCHAKHVNRHVLSGGQNVHACRARRTTKSQTKVNLKRKSRDHYPCAGLTGNRHASVLYESYAKSFVYSFGLIGEDHGEAMGVLNESRDAARIGSSLSSSPMPSSFLLVV